MGYLFEALFWSIIAFLLWAAAPLGLILVIIAIIVAVKKPRHRALWLSLLLVPGILLLVGGVFMNIQVYVWQNTGPSANDPQAKTLIMNLPFEVYKPPSSFAQTPTEGQYIYVEPKDKHHNGVYMISTERLASGQITVCNFSTLGGGWKAASAGSQSASTKCRVAGTLKTGEKVFAQTGEVPFENTKGAETYYGVVKGNTFILVKAEKVDESVPTIDSAVVDWLNGFKQVSKDNVL